VADNNSIQHQAHLDCDESSTAHERQGKLRLDLKARTRILFVNRSYWPDMEATGQLLTELCEGLAGSEDFEISVLCGAPNFPAEGVEFQGKGTELVNNVKVRRTWHTTFDKSSFLGRLANFVTFCVSSFFALLFGPKVDVIVCQTDPPLSPIATCLVAFLRRVRFVCYLQDIYPDIAVECGKVREGFFIKVLRKFLVWCYCRAEKIVVVSNDMRDWLRDHCVDESKVVVIQNWVDTDALKPIKQNNSFRARHLLEGKFVVMYSGNVGQTQRFDMLLDAAERLKSDESIVFMIVGGGVRWDEVTEDVKRRDLHNVRFLPYQPKSSLSHSLSAADVQIVMLDRAMTRLMMPSKLYSALAAGSCVLGLGDPDSHLAEIIVDNGCGWFFGESQLDELVDQIERASRDAQLVRSTGLAARNYAVTYCDRQTTIGDYAQMLVSVSGVESEQSSDSEPVPAESPDSSREVELANSR